MSKDRNNSEAEEANTGKVLRGVLPVIPTLFKSDDTIDLEAQRAVVSFALKHSASAVVCPAVASEYNFLSMEERKTLVSLVTEEVNGQVPIIGGASAKTVEEVVLAARDCLQFGISYLMIMAPNGLGQEVEKHKEFFAQISEQIEGAQIILQNAPSPIGAGLAVEDIAEIVESNPMITYVKEETLPSGPAITALVNRKIPHMVGVIGGGGSRYMIDELNRGALAAMPAIELLDLHVGIYNAYAAGNQDKARQLYRWSLPLLVSQLIYRMRLTKYVLNARGITNDVVVRAPLPDMDEMTKKDIDQMLEDLKGVLL